MRYFLVTYYFLSGLIALGSLWLIRSNVLSALKILISWQYVFLGLMVAGILVAIMIKKPTRFLWEAAITLALFLGVWFLLLLILPLGFALALASILTLSYQFMRTVWLHDLFYLIGGVGVAINFAGWLTPEILIFLLVSFSIYDFVAGPPGGPMESAAKDLLSYGMVPGIVVIEKFKDLSLRIDEAIKSRISKGFAARSALLGAGDVILPIALVAQAGMRNFWNGLAVLLGLLTSIVIITLKKSDTRPRAVLPLLAIGAGLPFVALWIFKQV